MFRYAIVDHGKGYLRWVLSWLDYHLRMVDNPARYEGVVPIYQASTWVALDRERREVRRLLKKHSVPRSLGT